MFPLKSALKSRFKGIRSLACEVGLPANKGGTAKVSPLVPLVMMGERTFVL